jgi:phage shock protein E
MKNIPIDGSIVDVRSALEYDQSHYPGALNIPLEEVATRIAEFKRMKEPVVVYCRSGNRSGIAAGILKQNGISNVYNGGGLDDMLKQTNPY